MSDYSRFMSKNFVSGTFPPEVLVFPAISGTGTVGQALTATTGTWSNTPSSYTYQWVRGASTNVGTSVNSYTLVAGDSANSIRCIVSAVNAAGTTLGPPSNAIAVA